MHCTLVFLGTGTILDVFHITGIWHLVIDMLKIIVKISKS